MERFAFKIDKALKANLCQICRLCGIDNPFMVSILSEDGSTDFDDSGAVESELYHKIKECIGFLITQDDKMPQKICSLCLDKINDFYEFRDMCYATNSQLRQLLGLKDELGITVNNNNILGVCDAKDASNPIAKRGRKRKTEELHAKLAAPDARKECGPSTANGVRKKIRCDNIPLPKKNHKLPQQQNQRQRKGELDRKVAELTPGGKVLRNLCSICDQCFPTKNKLEKHLMMTHIPNVPRFICNACNEIILKKKDIRAHHLWHKLTKTPFECAYCDQILFSTNAYSRHIREHTYEVPASALVLDRQCPQCGDVFETNYLYNTHSCAVRTKQCAGCNRQQRTEGDYMRHVALCSKNYHSYSKHNNAGVIDDGSCTFIKNENDVEADAIAEAISRSTGNPLDMTPAVSLRRLSPSQMLSEQGSLGDSASNCKAINKKIKKGRLCSKEFKRVDELLKSTIDTFVSIKHEPEIQVDAEPICAHKSTEVSHLDEISHHDHYDSDDQSSTTGGAWQCAGDTNENTMNTEGMNMSESSSLENDAATAKLPILKLKIKKEHGTLNSSLLMSNNIHNEKKNKKKKKEKQTDNKHCAHRKNAPKRQDTLSSLPTVDGVAPETVAVCIKQECLHDDNIGKAIGSEHNGPGRPRDAEATVMTSIPLQQFETPCTSGVSLIKREPEEPAEDDKEEVNIKPNRLELDRMLGLIPANYAAVKQELLTGMATAYGANQDAHPSHVSGAIKVECSYHGEAARSTEDTYTALPMSKITIKSEIVDDYDVPDVQEQGDMPSEYFNDLTTQVHDTFIIREVGGAEEQHEDRFDTNKIVLKQEQDTDMSESTQCYDDEPHNSPEDVAVAKAVYISNCSGDKSAETLASSVRNEAGTSTSQPWQSIDKRLNTHSYDNALNLKIVAVSAGRSDLTFPNAMESTNEELTKPPDSGDCATICQDVVMEKEATSMAQPFHDATTYGSSTDLTAVTDGIDDIEEQQNLLNQEMLEQQATNSRTPAENCTTTVIGSRSSATNDKANDEEAENSINETTDAVLQQQQQQQQQQFARGQAEPVADNIVRPPLPLPPDDSNNNEIAENNNNANIERELQVEDNAGVIERLDSSLNIRNDPPDDVNSDNIP